MMIEPIDFTVDIDPVPIEAFPSSSFSLSSSDAKPNILAKRFAPSAEPLKNQHRLHFEASRADGTFSVHNLSTWSETRLAHFKQWKADPRGERAETQQMAHEIAERIRALFGGAAPDALITKPPRGKTPDNQPHAAEMLAERVAALLDLPYVDCIARNEPDSTAHLARSRHSNLADKSTFRLTQPAEKLVICIDDVTTTGSTLARCREALQDVPNLLFVYVVWH